MYPVVREWGIKINAKKRQKLRVYCIEQGQKLRFSLKDELRKSMDLSIWVISLVTLMGIVKKSTAGELWEREHLWIRGISSWVILNLDQRKIMIKCFVWSVALYASEN